MAKYPAPDKRFFGGSSKAGRPSEDDMAFGGGTEEAGIREFRIEFVGDVSENNSDVLRELAVFEQRDTGAQGIDREPGVLFSYLKVYLLTV